MNNDKSESDSMTAQGEWSLLPIGGAKGDSGLYAAYVCQSYAKGGAFRHLADGFGNNSHRAIVVETILGLANAGKTPSEIRAEMSKRHYGLGNNSAWSKWLDANVQWRSPEGELILLSKRHGEVKPASVDLGIVI